MFLNRSLRINPFLFKFQYSVPIQECFIYRQKHSLQKMSTVTIVPSAVAPKNEIEKRVDAEDLCFNNTREAFKSKTNYDLIRGLFVFHLCSIEFLVKNNHRILNLMRKVFGAALFKRILKLSFYGHFVAGENIQELLPVVKKMRKFGVQSILDYSVESDSLQKIEENTTDENMSEKKILQMSDKEFDKITKIFCKCVDTVANATKREGFAAIKLTALGRPELFIKYTEMIVELQNFFKALTGSKDENVFLSKISKEEFLKRLEEFQIKVESEVIEDWFKVIDSNGDGFIDYYDWEKLLIEKKEMIQIFTSFDVRKGMVQPLIQQFDEIEEKEFNNMMARIHYLANYAKEMGVGIMIDAEQTYYQPAISQITIELMKKYNETSCQIMNTYQAYLKNALSTIEIDLRFARRENFYFGCKLVRGAYMEEESKRAGDRGYENPINESYEATNEMYNKCLERLIKEHQKQKTDKTISVMIASHNEDSIRNAIQLIKEKQISNDENAVHFAQLYGMCDQISFTLGQAGYSAFKYVPYGPVEEVLPYLSRRAQENGSMLQNLENERILLWKELKRRLLSGNFIYRIPA